MSITLPPPGPSRQDPATFSDRADAFAAWLVAAVPQFNALAAGSIDTGNFFNLTVSGLITGNAITQSAIDTTPGRLLKVGDHGVGKLGRRDNIADFHDDANNAGGLYNWQQASGVTANHPGTTSSFGSAVVAKRDAAQAFYLANDMTTGRVYQMSRNPGALLPWRMFWDTGNTTVDGNGFIKEASPIVRLFADGIAEPADPVGASFQRLGPGHYALTGCPPLATEGWQVTPAGDGAGGVAATVDAPVWVGDTLHVFTRVGGVQADIPAGRFALLRFWQPAEGGESPPPVDAMSESDFNALLLARHQQSVTAAIEAHIEAQAHAMQYRSGAQLAGYRDSTVEAWREEAQAFIAWRDACWLAALAMLDAAQQGGPVPTVAEALAALPEWGAE